MPVNRMRMRPWLEQMIRSNSIPGLVWLDEEEKIFSISWKHGARHGWEVDKDACLFKQWAIHTGKYTEGQTTADPRTWKANFRCAIRSLPDIEEINDKSISKGQTAVRVYRMLQVTSKPKGKRSRTTNAKRRSKSSKAKAEMMDNSDAQCPADQHTQHHEETSSTQQSAADSTGEAVYVTPSEVPDWATSVEIGPNSTNILYRTFQISPEHSPEYGEPANDDIIQIARQLEIDTPWTIQSLPGSEDSSGFQSSETSTESYSPSSSSSSSPSSRSQWSDTSSADEIDPKLYTELVSGLLTTVEDLLLNSCSDNLNYSHNTNTTDYLPSLKI